MHAPGEGGAPAAYCPSCGKPLKNPGPTGRCLTCEFRARHAREAADATAKKLGLHVDRGSLAEAERTRAEGGTISLRSGIVGDRAEPASLPPPPSVRDTLRTGTTTGVRDTIPSAVPPPPSVVPPPSMAPPPSVEPPVADAAPATPRAAARAPTATLPAPASLPYGPEQVLQTIDDYDLLSELGRGGMGVVYRAYARRLQRFVAIKLIRSGDAATALEVARFLNEAMLAARLSHPNIVRIYDARQTSDGTSYFVMELIDGKTLGAYLDVGLATDEQGARTKTLVSARATKVAKTSKAEATKGGKTSKGDPAKGGTAAGLGPVATRGAAGAADAAAVTTVDLEAPPEPARLTRSAALLVLEKTARAVDFAHSQAVVHRDVKPDNIIVDAGGEPHVTDFGIAKALRDDSTNDLTQQGHVIGSPYYMSPEQANGEVAAIGPRSDVYSLGATLYHVLCGQTMFQGRTPMSIVVQVLSSEPPRPSAVARQHRRPPVPLDLETICLKATEKEAARRYQTAAELADELRRYLDGEPILARPVGVMERLGKKLRKNRRALAGAFIAATVVLTLGAAFAISLFDNIDRSSQSLQNLDRQQALAQASTLERAIRVNMLQGRADLARELVQRMQKDRGSYDGNVGLIRVLRIDKTPAYFDRKTRRQVEQRLAKPDVLQQIAKEHPELVDEIAELRRRGFPSIDKASKRVGAPLAKPVRVHDPHWRQVLATAAPVTYVEELPSKRRRMVVLKPIENSAQCQACHGGGDEYLDNKIRAVLVVRRPLDRLQAMIDSNRESTLLIGSGTIAALLILAAIYAKVFGIGFRRRRFGVDE